MWQKVTSSLDWYSLAFFTLVKLCQAPCDIKWQSHNFSCFFLPPLSTVCSRGQPDILKVCYFASAGTHRFGSFVLQVPYMRFFFQLFALRSMKSSMRIARFDLVVLYLFIWTFSPHCNRAHWMLRRTFIRQGIFIHLEHAIPSFHIE